jgi:ATP-binding cassette subfamily C exporter for protease/lipase
MNAPVRPAAAATRSPLREALHAPRDLYRRAATLSMVIGLLSLAPSWFMFEVYGRVLNSRNVATLGWLLAMVVGVYVMLELLELVRGRVLKAAAQCVDARIRDRVFNAAFAASLRREPSGSVQPFNDLKTIRDAIHSQIVTATMDLPSALLCIGLLFAMSPWLAIVALFGAFIQLAMLGLTERRTMPLLSQAIQASILAQRQAGGALRNAQVIESMGMLGPVHARWMKLQRMFLGLQATASDYAGSTTAVAKLVQTMQGSVLLGGACWIMLHGGLWGGAGMLIVASILGGRALQPLAQIVAQWRVAINARDAYKRLDALVGTLPPDDNRLSLPAPQGKLTAEAVVAAAPGQTVAILKQVSFAALPGELTLIIGPSASGKTTLARLLVGVWPTAAGKIRLDGADVYTWDKEELGPHVGYLPQNVELFDGTVAENIARFGAVDMTKVVEAATQAGLTEMIEALPERYDTRIGDEGANLSGGQRQRLGLARALYGSPHLVVLDEPNSSLDEAGDKQLLAALQALKARGATTVAITHRKSILPVADKLLVLNDGQVVAFGPRDDVLAAMKKANEQAAAARQQGAPTLPMAPRGAPA